MGGGDHQELSDFHICDLISSSQSCKDTTTSYLPKKKPTQRGKGTISSHMASFSAGSWLPSLPSHLEPFTILPTSCLLLKSILSKQRDLYLKQKSDYIT
jgi:hypothetical protein